MLLIFEDVCQVCWWAEHSSGLYEYDVHLNYAQRQNVILSGHKIWIATWPQKV